MSAIDRTTILRGPGSVTYGGQTFYDADGITAEWETATGEIPSSVSGPIGTMKTDQKGKVTFTPCGQMNAALLAILFPSAYQNPTIGASVCGSADRPLLVHSLLGTKVTFLNAILSKMPEIRLSPIKTSFGAAEFSAALAKGKAPGDTGALFTTASGATYNLGNPDPTGIVGVQYAATYGELEIEDTAEGWTVTPEITLEPVTTDLLGTIDWTIASVGCTATCTPLGLSEDDILGALPVKAARGSLLVGDEDLVITGEGGLEVSLHNATLMRGPLQWGNTTLRAGEIMFQAHRSFNQGTAGAVFTVAMASSGTGS
jgi:hypothetical protein